MTNVPVLVTCVLGMLCVTPELEAQGLTKYRGFELGDSLTAVAARAGLAVAAAKTIHRRPAILQDLEWRPSRWVSGSSTASVDPVEVVTFSFYDDRLYRLVIDYSHPRTEGMTEADMIEALSVAYGPHVPRASWRAGLTASGVESESGPSVARWTDERTAALLFQTSSYRRRFRLIVVDTRLHELARKAEVQASKLDEKEAPSREVARQKRERDEADTAAEQARSVNKKAFKP